MPQNLIAQQPAAQRDASRLLVLNRATRQIQHRQFPDLLDFLDPGDVLVMNNSRVIPARLRGINHKTGGRFEILLLEEVGPGDWWAMLRPGKRARPGTVIRLQSKAGTDTDVHAEVTAINPDGHRRLRFRGTPDLLQELEALGEMPLPPYIRRSAENPDDAQRYQTVFASPPGSVAAPTAGLHFTTDLIRKIRDRGIQTCFVTLHVGAGTFLPVKAANVADHAMHSERFEIGAETVAAVLRAKKSGNKVVAAGTTSLRAMESAARANSGIINVCKGKTDIFIHPPSGFQVADALLTNFHLPESTLLMLVSAFAAPHEELAGRDLVLSAYSEAVRLGYRFFSYGDAMLIL